MIEAITSITIPLTKLLLITFSFVALYFIVQTIKDYKSLDIHKDIINKMSETNLEGIKTAGNIVNPSSNEKVLLKLIADLNREAKEDDERYLKLFKEVEELKKICKLDKNLDV